VRVWVSAWEWQCCGAPFSLGAEVTWGLCPTDDQFRAWIAKPLGAAAAASLTHYETHHQGADDAQPTPTCGRVNVIEAVYWKLALRPDGDPVVRFPVASSAAFHSRESADGWETEEEGGPSFAGYVVSLSQLG
jgi:hypothetical protein